MTDNIISEAYSLPMAIAASSRAARAELCPLDGAPALGKRIESVSSIASL